MLLSFLPSSPRLCGLSLDERWEHARRLPEQCLSGSGGDGRDGRWRLRIAGGNRRVKDGSAARRTRTSPGTSVVMLSRVRVPPLGVTTP